MFAKIQILQKRLHLNDPQNSKENRFIFELFANLISNGLFLLEKNEN